MKRPTPSPEENKGFTIAEIVVAMVIVTLIGTISLTTFVSARKSKELITLSNQVYAVLERAKADAIASKNGQAAGVKFSTSTYVYFAGNAYDSANPNNRIYQVGSRYQITTTLPSSDKSVVFSRLYGAASATGTIDIADASTPTRHRQIVIGNLGDLTVIK